MTLTDTENYTGPYKPNYMKGKNCPLFFAEKIKMGKSECFISSKYSNCIFIYSYRTKMRNLHNIMI